MSSDANVYKDNQIFHIGVQFKEEELNKYLPSTLYILQTTSLISYRKHNLSPIGSQTRFIRFQIEILVCQNKKVLYTSACKLFYNSFSLMKLVQLIKFRSLTT